MNPGAHWAWEAGRTPTAEAGLRKEYFATTESRQSLVTAVCARAQVRAQGAKVAVVSDGAALSWVDLDPILPHRIEILDFYHVLERVGKTAKHYAATDEAAATWCAAIKESLLNWGPGKLLQDLQDWQPTSTDAQDMKREQLNYFQSQQQRMNYPEYLRLGYPIGSGAVEGACKHVVSDRFRRSGMSKIPETFGAVETCHGRPGDARKSSFTYPAPHRPPRFCRT